MSEKTLQKLTALLTERQAAFRVLTHSAAGKTEEVAKVRGTKLEQGAKALVCVVKAAAVKQYVLAVLPSDKKADLDKIAAAFGGSRASLVSPKEVEMLTDCVFGAIPPFSFHRQLQLIVDPLLFQRGDEIAFNAGTLQHSIILCTQDYARITNPRLVEFVAD